MPGDAGADAGGAGGEVGERANFTGLVREAVSKPNFASKYAFESSRRDLHNALLCTAMQAQFFVKICQKIVFFLQNSSMCKEKM